MHTPIAALAWEFWRRHRVRLLAIAGLVLGFALVYPKLCALAGFNPASADPFGETLARNGALQPGPSLFRVVQFLYIVFLCCGPDVTMLLTLLLVIWIFTFTEVDQKTKDPLKFPIRLFNLPVSTPFLFWSFLLAGMASVAALYTGWVCLVPHPRTNMIGPHQNCFGWMTVLALTQGIVWALAAWPGTRMLTLIAVMFGAFGIKERYRINIFELPFVLPLGVALAFAGLQKMRHGQWQGWPWPWPFATRVARAESRGPKRFASPAKAQLWFEWRRFTGGVCYITVAMALVPMVIVLARVGAGYGLLSKDALGGCTAYLVYMPMLIYFCYGASPRRLDQPFLMVRPLTNGEMIMPMLKTAAVSVAFSWAAILAAFGVITLLGDYHALKKSLNLPPGCMAAIVIGLIFLTWRMIAAGLCYALSDNRRLQSMPVWQIAVLVPGLIMLKILAQNEVHWHLFLRLLPGLLLFLVAVKFMLAFLAFRVSLKQRLLAPNALAGYLTVWILLVAALLTTLFLTGPPKAWMFPLTLGVILLVPLARIGLCPISLARYRHA